MSLIGQTAVIYAREMRPLRHEPWGLIFNLTQPLIFLLLFGPLLAHMPGTGEGSPWQWFVPGILVMLGLSTTAGAGYTLQTEMATGSHERLLVTPLNRAALLTGRTLKEVIQLLVQAALIILVVLPLGFQLFPLGVMTGLLMLAVFGVGLGSLSFALAIATKNQEWLFWMVQQTFLFPLLILSGTLLPLDNAPQWMQTLSRLNPVTHIVNAERALFAGDFSQPSILFGATGAVVIAVLGLYVGTRAMRNATV